MIKKKRLRKVTSFTLDPLIVEWIDSLVFRGIFQNRSDALDSLLLIAKNRIDYFIKKPNQGVQ